MKKVLVLFVITILYVLPLSALAQRPVREQTKSGKYEASVIYDAVNEFKQGNYEGSNHKSHDAHYVTTLHVQFVSSQRVKAIRHGGMRADDGFTTILPQPDPQATGRFSYTHSGELHTVSNDGYDIHTDIKEEAGYSGSLTKAGYIDAEFPDTGDEMTSAGAGAGGIGSGFFKKILNYEEYVKAPGESAMQARKRWAAPEIDTDCQDGEGTGPLTMTGKKSDIAQSPETACSVDFPITRGAFSVMTKVLTPEEMERDHNPWAGAKFAGSFASGKYTITLAKPNKPKDLNTEIQNGVNTYSETLSFGVTLTLGGVTAEIFSPVEMSNSNLLAEILMPDDKLRSSKMKLLNSQQLRSWR